MGSNQQLGDSQNTRIFIQILLNTVIAFIRNKFPRLQNPNFEYSTSCIYCGMGFKTQRGLKIHTGKMHSIKKNFECNTCGEKFKNRSLANFHKRRAHLKSTQILSHYYLRSTKTTTTKKHINLSDKDT
mmetsp:Transcript_3872/g.5884  ORF Transcript_3872/g.5884 Transcript_3872/m.5884 type:complete len:128 (-) Transcript_3872:20-403(-)